MWKELEKNVRKWNYKDSHCVKKFLEMQFLKGFFVCKITILCKPWIRMHICAGFVWEKVNFIHSLKYGAKSWICAENSVDNTRMFSLLLSSAYTEWRHFLPLTLPHQQVDWEFLKSWEETQPEQLTPTDQKGTPFHMMSCSAIKAGERGRKGRHLELWHLSCHVTIMNVAALCSWRWLNTCLLMGSSEWIPWFALLARAAFAILINLSLLQLTSFLTFTLPVLSPVPLWGSEQVAVWCSVAG